MKRFALLAMLLGVFAFAVGCPQGPDGTPDVDTGTDEVAPVVPTEGEEPGGEVVPPALGEFPDVGPPEEVTPEEQPGEETPGEETPDEGGMTLPSLPPLPPTVDLPTLPAEETPAEETPAEETPAEEPPAVEETPAPVLPTLPLEENPAPAPAENPAPAPAIE